MQYKSLLLQSLQFNLRLQHLSRRTEEACLLDQAVHPFGGAAPTHPSWGATEVRRFLSYLVEDRHLSAATQQRRAAGAA